MSSTAQLSVPIDGTEYASWVDVRQALDNRVWGRRHGGDGMGATAWGQWGRDNQVVTARLAVVTMCMQDIVFFI